MSNDCTGDGAPVGGDDEAQEVDHPVSQDLRVSVWLLDPGGVTGAYVGDGVLTRKDFVVLHPGTARRATVEGLPARLRIAAETRWVRYVTDGSVMQPVGNAPELLLAVELDWPIAEESTPVPGEPGFSDLAAWLAGLEDRPSRTPAAEPQSPERVGYERKPQPDDRVMRAAGGKGEPWWCQVWPGCWGCK